MHDVGNVCRSLDAEYDYREKSGDLIQFPASAFFRLHLPELADENSKQLDNDGCRDIRHDTQREDRYVSEGTSGEHIEQAEGVGPVAHAGREFRNHRHVSYTHLTLPTI